MSCCVRTTWHARESARRRLDRRVATGWRVRDCMARHYCVRHRHRIRAVLVTVRVLVAVCVLVAVTVDVSVDV